MKTESRSQEATAQRHGWPSEVSPRLISSSNLQILGQSRGWSLLSAHMAQSHVGPQLSDVPGSLEVEQSSP